MKKLLVPAVLGLTCLASYAGTEVTEITDQASTVFGIVAGICVTIGVFMIGYRLARKIR
jgi:hypothetical protein